jgi:RHS repeat-associated protein
MILMPRPTSITGTAFEASSTNALLCVYDAWNRMSRVYADSGTVSGTRDDSDALVAMYQYDGQNRRVAKLLPTGSNFKRTDYYYNENWQVLEERYIASVSGTTTAATAASRKMLWDARYIDAPVWQWDGSLCCYYLADANMNVTTWVLSGGTGPYTRYEYDPYGLPRLLDAGSWDRIDTDLAKTETLYCGYRYDPETGLYQVRERYYHPTLGRWGQWDKIGYRDGMNWNQYCVSSPTVYQDPFGLMAGADAVKRVDDASWLVKSALDQFMTAYDAYIAEMQKVEDRIKACPEDRCCEVDLRQAVLAEEEMARKFERYISRDVDMLWTAKSYWAESGMICPWEKGELEWFFDAFTRTASPGSLALTLNEPALNVAYKQWAPSIKQAMDATDAEVQRVLQRTSRAISAMQTVHSAAEAATVVVGVGALAKVATKGIEVVASTVVKEVLKETAKKEWAQETGQQWPKDPKIGRNQDVSHKVPKADGGSPNDLNNIEPKPHDQHMQDHMDNGDFKRWGSRSQGGGQ